MRRLITALITATAVSGCAVWDAYMLTGYDPNEYRIIAEIRTDAYNYKQQCANRLMSESNAILISDKTQLFEFYSEQIPRNNNGVRASKNLNAIAQGLKTQYQNNPAVSVSPLFCKLKFASIENSAAVIQHVVGKRPR
jgi:hypothetical protein